MVRWRKRRPGGPKKGKSIHRIMEVSFKVKAEKSRGASHKLWLLNSRVSLGLARV